MSSWAYIFQIFFLVGLLYAVGRDIFGKGMVEGGLWYYCKAAHISRQIHNGDLLLLCVDVNLSVLGKKTCAVSYQLTIVTYCLSRFIPSIGFYELIICYLQIFTKNIIFHQKKIILLAFYQSLWEIIVIHISSKQY